MHVTVGSSPVTDVPLVTLSPAVNRWDHHTHPFPQRNPWTYKGSSGNTAWSYIITRLWCPPDRNPCPCIDPLIWFLDPFLNRNKEPKITGHFFLGGSHLGHIEIPRPVIEPLPLQCCSLFPNPVCHSRNSRRLDVREEHKREEPNQGEGSQNKRGTSGTEKKQYRKEWRKIPRSWKKYGWLHFFFLILNS